MTRNKLSTPPTTPNRPSALRDGHICSRYLVLVSGKGGEDFFPLPTRHFDEVKGAPKFGGDLVEFVWRDPEVTMCFLKTYRSLSRPCGRVLERPARDGANPKGSH